MIADLLGVQKSTLKDVLQLNERLKAKAPRKKPPAGVAREVLQLGGCGLTSLPIVGISATARSKQPSEDQRIGRETCQWVYATFTSPAHPHGVHLHRWTPLSKTQRRAEHMGTPNSPSPAMHSSTGSVTKQQEPGNDAFDQRRLQPTKAAPEADHTKTEPEPEIKQTHLEGETDLFPSEMPSVADKTESRLESFAVESPSRAARCCEYIYMHPYEAAAYNKRAQVVRYSSGLYQKLVATLNPQWTQWETDYLFDLCAQFDLRFIIIQDRYNPEEAIQATIQEMLNASGPKEQASPSVSSEPLSGQLSDKEPGNARETEKAPSGVSSSIKLEGELAYQTHSSTSPSGGEIPPIPKTIRSDSPLPSVLVLRTMRLETLRALLSQVQSANPRSLEHLKQRYYSIARKVVEYEFNKKIQAVERRFSNLASTMSPENVDMLTQQKTQLLLEMRTEMARHPLIKFQYDIAADKQRREYLERQYRMTEKEHFLEQKAIQQIVKSELVKRAAVKRDEWTTSAKRRKRLNAGHHTAGTTGSGGSTQQALDGLGGATMVDPIPLNAVQHHLQYRRKAGPTLASQVMHQFAAPLLLQPASSAGSPLIASSLQTSGTSTAPLGAGGTTSGGQRAGGTPVTSGAALHVGTGVSTSAVKRHEDRIATELKNLGFGVTGAPLWPTYHDKEIVDAFNALRIDIATMINWNVKVEQLEKERSLWKHKVSQLKDETTPNGTRCSEQSQVNSDNAPLPPAESPVSDSRPSGGDSNSTLRKKHRASNPDASSSTKKLRKGNNNKRASLADESAPSPTTPCTL